MIRKQDVMLVSWPFWIDWSIPETVDTFMTKAVATYPNVMIPILCAVIGGTVLVGYVVGKSCYMRVKDAFDSVDETQDSSDTDSDVDES